MKFILPFIATLLLASSIQAQDKPRVLVGATVGNGYGNLAAGPTLAMEAPITKHFELDAEDDFLPAESHAALGRGWANKAKAGGTLWIAPSFGLTGSTEYSQYAVTAAAKGADYAFGGVVFRASVMDAPTRVYLNIIKQFNNGVSSNGTETSHLIGGGLNWVIRVGCLGSVCFRVSEGFSVGRILQQGNQNCDGSIGPQTCGPRKGSITGGADFSFQIEIPRHKGLESSF